MKYAISKEFLEEICCCIVDCGLDRDEACDCAQIVGGEILKVTPHWAMVGCGDYRYLISA